VVYFREVPNEFVGIRRISDLKGLNVQYEVCYIKLNFLLGRVEGEVKTQRLLCDESDNTGTHYYIYCSIAIMAVL
jgi:hypothetical protein